MPIRYLGIDIGQVQKLTLITARNEVQATAVLYPEYVQTFARAGSRFSVVTPQISAAGLSISTPYFSRTLTLNRVGATRVVSLSCRRRPSPIPVIWTV